MKQKNTGFFLIIIFLPQAPNKVLRQAVLKNTDLTYFEMSLNRSK